MVKPIIDGRLSWYERRGTLDGANLLITCLSGSPKYLSIEFVPPDKQVEEPFLAGLETWYACRMLEDNWQTIVGETNALSGSNRTLDSLVRPTFGCWHPNLSVPDKSRCTQSRFEAIDWMIERGAPISPVNSCGYLFAPALDMNEEIFDFLLSRGADRDQTCPPKTTKFGNGVEELVNTKPETVTEMLNSLLSEYSDKEKEVLVSGWVRMLEALEYPAK
jgi:hypothetical protein